MQVERTKVIGFCGGVRRAIEMAEQTSNAYIAGGEIIHNSQEISRLEQNFNIKPETNIGSIPNGATAIIRAHGIGISEQSSMEQRNIKVIDATCPSVKRVQDLAKKFTDDGSTVLLFGDKNHAEVLGIIGHTNGNVIVFSEISELENIFLPERVVFISQTTKPIKEFKKAEQLLSEKIKEFECICTICPATQNNQNAAEELAKFCDVMIVIGGKKSSNTKALISAASQYCNNVYQIETEMDLDENWFVDKKHCGIAAGLSTPNYVIEKVESTIKKIAG